MTYDQEMHRRRSIRAKGYDYSLPGSYFVTICTWGREPVLGEVVDGVMRINVAGALVLDVWKGLPNRFPGVGLDAFVVMPNHVHAIRGEHVGRRGGPSGQGRPCPYRVAICGDTRFRVCQICRGRACPARPPCHYVP